MKKLFPALAVSILITSHLFSKEKIPPLKNNTYKQDTTYHIFSTQKTKYGFDILVDKKIFIHQPFIPAIQGNKSFSTKADAVKTAKLMLFKLKNYGMPPTISTTELDSLHIKITQ